MSLVVSCACGGKFRARADLAGRTLKCPRCGAPLLVPSEIQPPPVESWEPVPVPDPTPNPVRAPAVDRSTKLSDGRSMRDWLYLALAFTLVPLLWSTFHPDRRTLADQLRQTIAAHPEVRKDIERISDEEEPSIDEIFNAIPDHRLDGAILEHGSKLHWLFALLAAAVFFGLALLMLPADSTRPLHVFLTGVFTGTAGVLLLLAVQFIASMMRGRMIIPRSIVGLIFLVLKGIQLSYDAANDPDSNFVLSALGFTFGVGLCEELCKALPLLWHYRRKATLDWRGACLWGFLSGIGFGLSEAIMYCGDYYNGIYGGGIYLVRFISCAGLHGIWAAAAGIFIYKHQNLIQDAGSWYQILFNSVVLVAVPMVLHGFYDTMLKKEMNVAAMVVALISFAWLVFQIEHARRTCDEPSSAAYA